MIITREWLRARETHYSDDRIDAIVSPDGATPLQVLDSGLPAFDLIWVLAHEDVLGRAGVVEFARWCAERAQLQADSADIAVYALSCAASAASGIESARVTAFGADRAAWAAANTADVPAVERRAQLDWIRNRLDHT